MDSKINLYPHNKAGYTKVKEAYDSGERVVGIVHATGTGKTYISLKLCLDNPTMKTLFVVPSNAIIEHIKETIVECGLSLEKDFPNLQFCTYQSLSQKSDEDLAKLDVDMLILDEFHHIGAPVWGEKVDTIVNTHPKMKVFGMTAYTVRDRGTSYERDMALSGGNELFSDKIVSTYDLVDAMCDGVLPIPNYKSAYLNLLGYALELEHSILNANNITKEDKDKYLLIIKSCKAQIDKAPNAKKLIEQNLKSNDKCIYFCPIGDKIILKDDEILGTNNISDIRRRIGNLALKVSNATILYETTSTMGEVGKLNRNHFYNDTSFFRNEDVSNILRIMFAINQYNEGVHAPGVTKVFLARQTNSDIVYYEQIGRALSVRGNIFELTKEYEEKTKEELIIIANSNGIDISRCNKKEEIIERLLAPTIIDLVGNIDFIRELRNNLKNRIKERIKRGIPTKITEELVDASFNIDIVNEEIYEILQSISQEILKDGWEEYFQLAKEYFEEHGDLRVPIKAKARYITPNNKNLGNWISTQRDNKKKGTLSEERINKLNSIGMIWDAHDDFFYKMYALAVKYKSEHGNIQIPKLYVTENGEKLGSWLSNLKFKHNCGKLNEHKTQLLEKLGIVWKSYDKSVNFSWDEWYELAKKYQKQFGDLNINAKYKTDEGERLGFWLVRQRVAYKEGKLTESKIQKLEELGIIWDPFETHWKIMFKAAKEYYEEHGNLFVKIDFITEQGDKLGSWLALLRYNYKNGKLSQERIDELNSIGMIWDVNISLTWDEWYELAKQYSEKHGNLNIDSDYITAAGEKLGNWIYQQIALSETQKLSNERRVKLENIGLIGLAKNEYWNKNLKAAKEYYKEHGNLDVPKNYPMKDLITWIDKVRKMYENNELSILDIKQLELIGMIWNVEEEKEEIVKRKKTVLSDIYELLKKYHEEYGNLNIPQDYRTEDGVGLGKWVSRLRTLYKNNELADEIILELEKLGMVWFYYDEIWDKMLKLAKHYKEEHGDLMISKNYCTKEGDRLGLWLSNCRGYYKKGKLSEEKIKSLEALGMVWFSHDEQWNQTFEKARQYFLTHGNLKIQTKDCSTEELSLKNWLIAQRQKYKHGKLTQEQISKLESIEFSFEIRMHKSKIKEICKKYSIDYSINQNSLAHLDADIFEHEIIYFIEHNIPYIDSNGMLISDFYMSSKDFETKYNVSIQELVNNKKKR